MLTLRREYEAMQTAKQQQEQEVRDLKHKVVSGGAKSPAARNKMLVRGASSFNSLVRALKQDLIDHTATAKNPSLMLEIDKMAMDKVHVFPDGELKIEAVKKANETSTPSFR